MAASEWRLWHARLPLEGSGLRDVLASERTFLAYVRASVLSFVVGAALKVRFESRLVLATSVVFVATGVVLTTYGLICHMIMVYRVGRGELEYGVDGVGIWIVSAVAIVVAVLAFALVFTAD